MKVKTIASNYILNVLFALIFLSMSSFVWNQLTELQEKMLTKDAHASVSTTDFFEVCGTQTVGSTKKFIIE